MVKRWDQVAAFVLAGGGSTRMGRDKALLELCGEPMVTRAAHIAEPHVASVAVVAPAGRYAELELPLLPDRWPGAGPLGGIATALSTTRADWNLILGCDLPYLTSEWLAWFIPCTMNSAALAVVPESRRGLEPLAAMYHRACAAALTAAVERGVNDHEVGHLVQFALKHPAVRGINFQPAFHAGRHIIHDPLQRMTIPDVVRGIEEQTGGLFRMGDFVPVPCCFPTCNSVTYAYLDGEMVVPLPRVLNVDDHLDYITNRVIPDLSFEVRRALEGLWSSSAVPGGDRAASDFALSCSACDLSTLAPSDIAKRMFMIMLQDFMDPWTFNQKNLMKCCKEFLLPGGHQIPFCAYNTVGYREQAREQLVMRDRERRRAKREGRPFEPAPLAFDFSTR